MHFDLGAGPVAFGGCEVHVHHTPGHSPGGVCLRLAAPGVDDSAWPVMNLPSSWFLRGRSGYPRGASADAGSQFGIARQPLQRRGEPRRERLEELSRRVESFTLSDSNRFEYFPSFLLRGLTRLDVADIVPAGASTSSPSSVNVAWPETTT